MTTGTTSLWTRRTRRVLRVIKFHVERFVEARRKIFQRRVAATDVRMADSTHRHLRRGELAAMTIGARLVTGKARRGRVVGAFVTGVTGKGTVTLAVVEKL